MKIAIETLNKKFGAAVALAGVSLEIRPGEIFFLLGPSGCGKTTLLRIIAGFCRPDSGRLLFDDHEVTDSPPHLRRTAMVFQNYALWPHMNVAENVAFGLTTPGPTRLARDQRRQRVDEMLACMHLSDLAARRPAELSGGQQQRVALARAMAVRPDCLLLDEPLSNLDAKLRQEMRVEIRRVIKQAGITAVYVTHDQQEALSMADRCAVMRDGRVVQAGAPDALYRDPADIFVADFIGGANLLPGMVAAAAGGERMRATTDGISWLGRATAGRRPETGTQVAVGIRPENLRIDIGHGQGDNRHPGRIVEMLYMGHTTEYWVKLTDAINLRAHAPAGLHAGDAVTVHAAPDDVMIITAG